MTEAVTIEAGTLSVLNDQLWRRLGVTQTFDRLLIEAAARAPGPVAGVREAAGRNLQGGAARFYEMTFPQIVRDLVKRAYLHEKDGTVGLDPIFAERMRRMVSDHTNGASRVAPTPGVTIESIEEEKEKRAEREKAQKAATRKSTGDKATRAAKAAGGAPKKRAGAGGAQATAQAAPEADSSSRLRISANDLFTSQRVNKLLECLDTGALNREQLGNRLGLGGKDLERFLGVTEGEGVTRLNSSNVELHWKGRELARTQSADRRVAVMDTVKGLRDRAQESEA